MESKFRNVKYQECDSKPGCKEIVVSYSYKGKKQKYFIFLNKNHNWKSKDYINEAKKVFQSKIKDGSLEKYAENTNDGFSNDVKTKPLAILTVFLSVAVATFASLLFYRFFTSNNPDGPTPTPVVHKYKITFAGEHCDMVDASGNVVKKKIATEGETLTFTIKPQSAAYIAPNDLVITPTTEGTQVGEHSYNPTTGEFSIKMISNVSVTGEAIQIFDPDTILFATYNYHNDETGDDTVSFNMTGKPGDELKIDWDDGNKIAYTFDEDGALHCEHTYDGEKTNYHIAFIGDILSILSTTGTGGFEDFLSYGNYYITKVELLRDFISRNGSFACFTCGLFPDDPTLTEVSIGAGVTFIPDYMFRYTNTTKVFIPNSVKYIGDYAFYQAYNLEEFSIESNSQLLSIGDCACTTTNITSLFIPKKVKTIGVYAFGNNPLLTDIKFEEGSALTKLSDDAFNSAGSSSSEPSIITIPSNIKTIGQDTFYLSNFSEIIFPSDSELTTIDNGAFSESSLVHFDIPSKVTTIKGEAFSYCRQLESVTFPSDCLISTIPERMFYFSTALSSIKIPNSVEEIKRNAFECDSNLGIVSSLETVMFQAGSKLKKINDFAFFDSAMRSFVAPKSLETIGPRSFEKCKNLSDFEFEEGSQLRTIGSSAFTSSPIISFTIPDTVESIGSGAFTSWGSLMDEDGEYIEQEINVPYPDEESATAVYGQGWNDHIYSHCTINYIE